MVILEEGTKGSFPSTCPQEVLEASSALTVCNLSFLSAAKESLKFKLNELRQRKGKSCYF